jgi:hypothetical protein
LLIVCRWIGAAISSGISNEARMRIVRTRWISR